MNSREWLGYLAYKLDSKDLARIGNLLNEAKEALPIEKIIPDFELIESMVQAFYYYNHLIDTLKENGHCFWKDRANPQCVCNGDCEYKSRFPVPICFSCVHYPGETFDSAEGKYAQYCGTCLKHCRAGLMLKCPDYESEKKEAKNDDDGETSV